MIRQNFNVEPIAERSTNTLSGSPLTLYQGAMASIPQTTIIDQLVLPEGQWNWYIVVDDDMNGVINGTWWDVVRVTVRAAAGPVDR